MNINKIQLNKQPYYQLYYIHEYDKDINDLINLFILFLTLFIQLNKSIIV